MSAYSDSHRKPTRDQRDQQPPKGGGVVPSPLPIPDDAVGGLGLPPPNPVPQVATTTTTTVLQQPSMVPQTNPTAAGTGQQRASTIEVEDDDEAHSELDSQSDPDGNSDSDEEDFQIPTKEDVAGFLGLPKEAGPTGLAKEVGSMSVDDAVERYALPPEHLEELRKAVSSKLAQVPWPRKVPRNTLSYGKRLVDGILVKQEEDIRLMMALMMADRPDIALAVGLNSLVRTEKLRADRVRWTVRAEVPESTPEPLRMFQPEEQAAINRKIATTRVSSRPNKFFRSSTKMGQGRQQQTATAQQGQRGRTKPQAPRNESQGKPPPNGSNPHHL